ncbi:uncharacterized protein CC84DRAFT_1095635, partial [Paraphaeosphaeria sporulosa]
DDTPLQAAYYNGLKEIIKDELVHHDKADDLDELIELAVRVDNRLYERQTEKKELGKPTFR